MTTRPTLSSYPEDAELWKWAKDVEGFVEELVGSNVLPSAPAEVKVVSQLNSVKVTFRAVNEVGVSEYNIYRGTDKNFTGGNSELIATVTQAIDPSGIDIVYTDVEAVEKSYYFVSAVKGLRRPRLEGPVAGFGSSTQGHAIGEDLTGGGTITGFSGIPGSILFVNEDDLVDQDNENFFYSQTFRAMVVGPAGLTWGPHNSPDVYLVRDAPDILALKRGSNDQKFRVYEDNSSGAGGGLITQTLLLAEIDTVDRTVYTTSSISPTPDKLILIFITGTDFTLNEPIFTNSVTGAGLTWVEIVDLQMDTIAAPRQIFSCYRALGPSAVPGALTITFDVQAALAQWIIVEFDNVDTSGTNGSGAIVQAATNVSDSAMTLTATLAEFSDSNNATVGGFGCAAGGTPTWTPGSGFIEIAESTGSDRVSMVQFRNDNDTSVDATLSDTSDIAVIALEIKNAVTEEVRYIEMAALGSSGEAEVMAVTGQGATDRALVIGTRGDESIDFYVNDAEAVRVESTGEFLIQDGTVLLPGIAFISDPDTGLFNIPSNRIGIVAGGTELMRLQNDQVTLQGNGSIVFSAGVIGGPDDVRLRRTAPYTLKLEFLANAQTFEIYNTFTSVTDNELAELGFIPVADTFVIGTKKGSAGGTARPLVLRTDEIEVFRLGVSGAAVFSILHSHAFTSDGSGTDAALHKLSGTLTGADEDTGALFGMDVDPTIVTQTATESIANIASLNIEEPKISDLLTGDITVASTLRIGGAPDEGLRNYALRIEAGATRVGFSGDSNVPDLEFSQDGFGFTRSGSSRLVFELKGTAVEVAWGINSGQFMRDSAFLGWSDNGNPLGATHRTEIRRQADGVLEIRNVALTTPTGWELFNTWVSATSNEVAQMSWLPVSDVFVIGTKKGSGGGTARAMRFRTDEIAAIDIDTSQKVIHRAEFSQSNVTEGGTAQVVYKTAHEAHTLAAAKTSDTTTISIPAGAKLLGASFNVNTAVTDDDGDNTWSAAFITGASESLASGAAAAQNTKVNSLTANDEVATATTEIQFTANGSNFTAGVIEIVVYYMELTSLADV